MQYHSLMPALGEALVTYGWMIFAVLVQKVLFLAALMMVLVCMLPTVAMMMTSEWSAPLVSN